jgi:hypothetical protein
MTYLLVVRTGGEVCRLGGRWVVNPSGGLESKGNSAHSAQTLSIFLNIIIISYVFVVNPGHPIGATGLAQCAELNWQVYIHIQIIYLVKIQPIVF